MQSDDSIILHQCDPAKRESLNDLVDVDPLAHEQSIITDEVCSKYNIMSLFTYTYILYIHMLCLTITNCSL